MIQILDKPKTKKNIQPENMTYNSMLAISTLNYWAQSQQLGVSASNSSPWLISVPNNKRIWTVVECYGTCTIIISIWLHVTHVLLRSFARLAIGWGTLRTLWFINSNDSLFKSSTPNQEKTHANRKITTILKTYNSNLQRHFPEKYYLEPQISLKIRCV